MNTIHIDAHSNRPCARCGRKTTTFSAPDSDKGLCANCVMQGAKKPPKVREGEWPLALGSVLLKARRGHGRSQNTGKATP